MKMEFKVEGNLDHFNLDNFDEELAKAMVEEVKMRTPVATGNLRDSIGYEMDGSSFNLGSDVEYAPFVEFGTRYMDAHGMFRTTLESVDAIAERVAQKMGLNKK